MIDNAIGLVSALFSYVETRAALLAVESKAMLLQLAAVLAFALGALIAVALAVFLLNGGEHVGKKTVKSDADLPPVATGQPR